MEIPWKSVFTSVPVYALILAHFGQNFGYFMLLTELPTYLEQALHFDIKQVGDLEPATDFACTCWFIVDQNSSNHLVSRLSFCPQNGLISSIPYLVQAGTSWAASYASDRIVRSERFTLSQVRKGFNSIGKRHLTARHLHASFRSQQNLRLTTEIFLLARLPQASSDRPSASWRSRWPAARLRW